MNNDESRATVNLGSESAVANNSREPGTDARSIKDAVIAEVKFPRCDAAVRNWEGSGWDLADAILAECSKPERTGCGMVRTPR